MKRYSVELYHGDFTGSVDGTTLYDRRRDRYAIFIDENLSRADRERTVLHELFHIFNGDFLSDEDMEIIEARADAFVDETYRQSIT